MRLASALLVITLLTTCIISGTFAKYISEKSATDTGTVAKWEFKVGDKDITEEAFTFDLFEDKTSGSYDEKDNDVVMNKIAPGTSGSFKLDLTNTSEVTAAYKIEFTETNGDSSGSPDASKHIPIQYCIGEGTNGALKNTETWSDDISSLNITSSTNLKFGDSGNTASYTIHWRWAYQKGSEDSDTNTSAHASQSDTNDTALGVAAQSSSAPQVTVTAKVTATQVD